MFVIFIPWRGWICFRRTGFYDLNKLSEYIDFSNYTEEELEYGSKNGVLNAIPIAMNTHTFYYNQDILDEYGMDVPLSWEDFEALGKRAKKDNRYALGFSKKQLLLFMIAYYEQNHAETVFNEDGTLTGGGVNQLTGSYAFIDDKYMSIKVHTMTEIYDGSGWEDRMLEALNAAVQCDVGAKSIRIYYHDTATYMEFVATE